MDKEERHLSVVDGTDRDYVGDKIKLSYDHDWYNPW